MNQWNNGKVLSNEELQREIKMLKRLIIVMYSNMPDADRNAVFKQLMATMDRDDAQIAAILNSYNIRHP